MENKEFDKLFNGLKDREITPSKHALSSLQDLLNEEDRKSKRRKLTPVWWAAAAIAVLLVGVGGYNSYLQLNLPSEVAIIEPDLTKEGTTYKEDDLFSEKKQNSTEKIAVKEEVKKVGIQEEQKIYNADIATSDITEQFKSKPVDKLIEIKEEVILETPNAYDTKLAELLKPVEDAELDMLLQSKQVALALEKLDDTTILNLLRDAQSQLEHQADSQIASAQANNLLQQAEIELAANKSLKGILNKAIETGVVEVQALFKRK